MGIGKINEDSQCVGVFLARLHEAGESFFFLNEERTFNFQMVVSNLTVKKNLVYFGPYCCIFIFGIEQCLIN